MLNMERPRKFVKVRVRNSANNKAREKHQANCPEWEACKGVEKAFESVRGILQEEEERSGKCKNHAISKGMIQFGGETLEKWSICFLMRRASE